MSDYSKPRTILSYHKFKPELKNFDEASILDFKSDYFTRLQGEAIEISEDLNLLLLAVSFSVLYSGAKELSLRLQDNRSVMIFSHTLDELYSRPKDIIEDVKNELTALPVLEAKSKKEDKYILDLSLLWQKLKLDKSDQDIVKKTITIIRELNELIPQVEEIHIFGQVPSLVFLSILYFCHPRAEKIIYFDDYLGPIKIFE